MEDDRGQFENNEQEPIKIVAKYEEMKKNESSFFFDVHEFEEIIDHYLGVNKLDNALEAVKYSIIQHPDSSILKLKYSQVLIDKEKPETALKILSRIEKIEEYNYEFYLLQGMAFYHMGNIDSATNSFEKAIEKSFNEKKDVLRDISHVFMNKSDYKNALNYLVQIREIDEKDINSVYDIASCYNALGKEKETIELYKDYLDADPFADSIWFNLGVLYFQTEQFEEAIEAFDYSMVITDEFVSTYYYKAISQMNLGRYEDAIKTYGEYIEADEETEEVFCFIAECYERMKDYENASKYYQKSIEINKDFPDAWLGLSLIHKDQELYEKALEYIEQAITLDIENGDFWFTKGEILKSQNNNVEALKAFRKAFEIDNQDIDSWMNYAEILQKEGKTETAIEIIKEAYQSNYDVAEINYRLAALYFIAKQKENALKFFERGLMLNFEEKEEFFNVCGYAVDDKDIINLINLYKNSKDEL